MDLWVMHGMVFDENWHVFPGGGVGELLRVCQQDAFVVYHSGRCPADCLSKKKSLPCLSWRA